MSCASRVGALAARREVWGSRYAANTPVTIATPARSFRLSSTVGHVSRTSRAFIPIKEGQAGRQAHIGPPEMQQTRAITIRPSEATMP